MFLTVLSLVYAFDSPYANILEQPKVLRLIVRLPVIVMYLYFLVLSDWGVLVIYSVVYLLLLFGRFLHL